MSNDLCVICMENIVFKGVYDCGHFVCGRCACKFVFLYKDMKCSQCNKINDKITLYENEKVSLKNAISKKINTNLMHFDTNNCKKFASNLLEVRCKECFVKIENDGSSNDSKEGKYLNFIDKVSKINVKEKKKSVSESIIKHFIEKHKNKYLCKVCLDRNFEFWDEFTQFSFEEYKEHKKRSHSHCIFCDKIFFDLKDLKAHAGEKHQICTICTVIGKPHIYLKNYSDLIKHYNTEHFCCTEKRCVESHCFAFAHKSELWAHLQKIHQIKKDLHEIEIKKFVKNPEKMNLMDESVENHLANQNTNIKLLNPVLDKSIALIKSKKPNKKTENDELLGKIKSILALYIKTNIEEIPKQIFTLFTSSETSFDQNTNKISAQKLSLYAKDIEEILQRYMYRSNEKEVKTVVHNLLDFIFGSDPSSKVFLSKFKNEIRFPSFKKSDASPKEETIEKKNTFKIVDLSHKTKK